MSNHRKLKAAESKLEELGDVEQRLKETEGPMYDLEDLEELRVGLLEVRPNIIRVGFLGGSELHRRLTSRYNELRRYLTSKMQTGLGPVNQ